MMEPLPWLSRSISRPVADARMLSLPEAHETIHRTMEIIKSSRELVRRLALASDGRSCWSYRPRLLHLFDPKA